MLPHSHNVTKLYYLLYLHHVGMVPKISKNRHFGIPKSIFSEPQCTSWLPGVPECPYRAAKKPRCRLSWDLRAKIPAFLVPGIWQYGVILYAREAIWTIWSLFPPFPRRWGTPKIIKNRDFLAPCCHTAKMSRNYIICYICTMLAWYQKHQKIDILASQNRYFRSLSAHLGFLECQNAHTELPRGQDAGFPGMPRYLASRYLVSGSME